MSTKTRCLEFFDRNRRSKLSLYQEASSDMSAISPGYSQPVPLQPYHDGEEMDERRLWVGNLDPRITEFTLLKLLQKYGRLNKLDFLYHKTGLDQGKPRGYCFVTYQTIDEAKFATKSLNGKFALSKKLVVRVANTDKKDDPVNEKSGVKITKQSDDGVSKETKIRAIEAKLKVMEQNPDLPLDFGVPSSSGTQQNSHKQGSKLLQNSQTKSHCGKTNSPYGRGYPR
ncbi:probable RNA-binding protein 18 [Lingula anatina]|uniref:Probable RNA-binding protein 18 n=1 Tax=Lingula anatina TaxID=7574 RepID=A0A1S3HF02_LINAN|nr:probable RNA-binding protein 18 [Lingula anatina]|eukprot:XP_013384610.1 probable RNA-binding protein 18 [Lingula anatina]